MAGPPREPIIGTCCQLLAVAQLLANYWGSVFSTHVMVTDPTCGPIIAPIIGATLGQLLASKIYQLLANYWQLLATYTQLLPIIGRAQTQLLATPKPNYWPRTDPIIGLQTATY